MGDHQLDPVPSTRESNQELQKHPTKLSLGLTI